MGTPLSTWEKMEQALTPYQARCSWEEWKQGEILLVFESREDFRAFSAQIREIGVQFRSSYHRKEMILYKE